MDDNAVEIVAAAPGTIVLRTDGNFDRSCGLNGGSWNAVYVRHADNSIAWYGNMKNGSVTMKVVGDTVAAGERLGVVGSSEIPQVHICISSFTTQLVSCRNLSRAQQLDEQLFMVGRPTALPKCPDQPAGNPIASASVPNVSGSRISQREECFSKRRANIYGRLFSRSADRADHSIFTYSARRQFVSDVESCKPKHLQCLLLVVELEFANKCSIRSLDTSSPIQFRNLQPSVCDLGAKSVRLRRRRKDGCGDLSAGGDGW